MARSYKSKPSEVIRRRIDVAATPAAKPSAGRSGSEARAMALLTIVDTGSIRPAASRAVARYVRDSCGSDKSVLAELLDALDLAGGEQG